MRELSPILIAALFVFLALALWRLKRAAQPLRLQLAEKGEQLLSGPHLTDEAKNYIRLLLDTAFSFRLYLIGLIILVPFFGIAMLFVPQMIWNVRNKVRPQDAATRADFYECTRLHHLITLANNPLLYSIFQLEYGLVLPAVYIGQALLRGTVRGGGGFETVVAMFQEGQHFKPNWHMKAAV